MDKVHYEEMKKNFEILLQDGTTREQDIYLFGHCNATEILADMFVENGCEVKGILDNNSAKWGTAYKEIPVVPPEKAMESKGGQTMVCIAARACASMSGQLKRMGYTGRIRKMTEYDSYAEYSLEESVVAGMQARLERGLRLLDRQKSRYPDSYRIYCPFLALGDVYYTMSYLPCFLKRKSRQKFAVFTIGRSCAEVAKLFGAVQVEALEQQEMDESVQAVLYTGDENAYIPHQDRPYAVKLSGALRQKKISLEMIYKCGVFGLDPECPPCRPVMWEPYREDILPGKAVILSPYAKSVTNISPKYWKQIVAYYTRRKYQIFTNTTGEERELEGTKAISPGISQLRSAVEKAGTFIGIRSGLCDVIREADCRKIALYPDCFYSDTRWKMADIYYLEGFENITVDSHMPVASPCVTVAQNA